jgi:seryl-tRNA synthetase
MRDGKTPDYYILNGSNLALPRIVAALLKNNQQEDNSFAKVLHQYFGAAKLNKLIFLLFIAKPFFC